MLIVNWSVINEIIFKIGVIVVFVSGVVWLSRLNKIVYFKLVVVRLVSNMLDGLCKCVFFNIVIIIISKLFILMLVIYVILKVLIVFLIVFIWCKSMIESWKK